jgi:hypothetical protein
MSYQNHSHLKEFVERHNLTDNNSLIRFKAIVTIKTPLNKITNEKMNLSIAFDGYNNFGTVTLLENRINHKLYPTEFKAIYQTMEFIDGNYLYITDTHPTIGVYEVEITPIV